MTLKTRCSTPIYHSVQGFKILKFSRRSLTTIAFVAVFVMVLSFHAFASSHRAADWKGLSEAGPLSISLEEAPGLFKQCSRRAPTPDGAVWLPQENEIGELEQRLGHFFAQKAYLQDHLMEGQLRYAALGRNPDLAKYRAQFVGFERGGNRYIYASYLAHSVALSGMQGDNAIIFCDGGFAAWGIIYDLQKGELSEFVSNRGP
ncbi:hypothetical protein [uncultured Tateyamaria sp.]|uniref:hypothetical protein n=1 Tax=uncultured Tateyamaria sp. TaxID=455651 RepID=UPI00262A889B|nr:hypothetical protein [uncultured Tateyamaria sp.]